MKIDKVKSASSNLSKNRIKLVENQLKDLFSIDGFFAWQEKPDKETSFLDKLKDIIVYPKRLSLQEASNRLSEGKAVLFELGGLKKSISSIKDIKQLKKEFLGEDVYISDSYENQDLQDLDILPLEKQISNLVSVDLGKDNKLHIDKDLFNAELALDEQKDSSHIQEAEDNFLIADNIANLRKKQLYSLDGYKTIHNPIKKLIYKTEDIISPDYKIKHIISEKFSQIKSISKDIEKLSDKELRAKTDEFIKRINNGEKLIDIMPEVYAVAAEAAKRTLGYYPYDEQLKGAVGLGLNSIIEMKTGEGKTLTSVMPIYLYALQKKGVHVVSANNYLAKRDAQNLSKVFSFLGLSTGYIDPSMDIKQKQKEYRKDITYGTISEFGFDYLRDNMIYNEKDKMQRGHNFLLVDEADFVMLDDATTPLIISENRQDSKKQLYYKINDLVNKLTKDEDYKVDLEHNSVDLTSKGIDKIEKDLNLDNLYSMKNFEYVHLIDNALRAKELLKKDEDYIIQNNKVVLINDKTGRIMDGRRYSNDLHQAIEAKEGLPIGGQSITLNKTSIIDYIKKYNFVAGMTGTAVSSKRTFEDIYNMPVVGIKTHRPVIRNDREDIIFKTKKEKYIAAAKIARNLHQMGRPVLIGTQNIDETELLSNLLHQLKIPHQVLNAKNHEKEAEIIKNAGKVGAVTIATNMAGRGVDIKLDKKAKQLGGLFVIGLDHSVSRRVDEQLRGRAGRQGQPGDSQFIVSLEDDIITKYLNEYLPSIEQLNIPEGMPIDNIIVKKLFKQAQERAENDQDNMLINENKKSRVFNKSQDIVFNFRNQLLKAENVSDIINHALKNAGDKESEKIVLKKDKEFSKQLDKDSYLNFVRSVYLLILDNNYKEYLNSIDDIYQQSLMSTFVNKDPQAEFIKTNYYALKEVLDKTDKQFVKIFKRLAL